MFAVTSDMIVACVLQPKLCGEHTGKDKGVDAVPRHISVMRLRFGLKSTILEFGVAFWHFHPELNQIGKSVFFPARKLSD